MSGPSIDQFAAVLSKVPDWYSLGVFLGAPSHELDSIRENYSTTGVIRCLIEVYNCLERLKKAPSWDFIANKLGRMNYVALAEYIDSTYIHPSLEPSSESSSSNSEQSGAGIPDSVDQTSRASKVMVPPEVSKQYVLLSRRLTKLCLDFKNALKVSNENIEDVQHVIKRHDLPRLAGNEATWENVFHRLDEKCSMFDDPHVLSDIIDIFLHDNQVLSGQMEGFKEAINSFKSSTEIGHLVELLEKTSKRRSNSQVIELKLKEYWGHCTVTCFEAAMRQLMGSLYGRLKCMLVTDGCYCISWIFADHDTPALNLLPKHSEELFKIIGVIYLQIGEEMVYDSTGEVSGCEVLEAAMLQAIELKNTRAIELLRLAMGCSPEVDNEYHAVTNVVRERSVDDGNGDGVDHVCPKRPRVVATQQVTQPFDQYTSTQKGITICN